MGNGLKSMRVLFCAPEVVPLAKTGGLADVAGALPLALAERGVDVRLAMPRYRSVSAAGAKHLGSVTVSVGADRVEGIVSEMSLPGSRVPVWLIDQPRYFDREGLYGDGGKDFPDNLSRFAFFSRAVLEWLGRQKWQPDVIHCHDWQTALIPVMIKVEHSARVATIFTIHNLAYQGLFPPEQFTITGLPSSLFTMRGLEYWGQINLLKGGLYFSDVLTTVSETYAREIQTEEFGAGLDGVLRDRRDDLFGILNGVDYSQWDPSVDTLIAAKYSAKDLNGKRTCKADLQRTFKLPEDPNVPLVGMVTRLADQKGLDLVAAVITQVLDLGVQFVLLGTGDPRYHRLFEELAARQSSRVGVLLGFNNKVAHQIEAGSDMFLMPSRYEPSGLNQLYSLRYGTIPIVRRTGGLADSIVDATHEALQRGTANGFVFEAYEPQALLQTIQRAIRTFKDKRTWDALQKTGMRADFSWGRSADRYVELYEKAAARARLAASPPR